MGRVAGMQAQAGESRCDRQGLAHCVEEIRFFFLQTSTFQGHYLKLWFCETFCNKKISCPNRLRNIILFMLHAIVESLENFEIVFRAWTTSLPLLQSFECVPSSTLQHPCSCIVFHKVNVSYFQLFPIILFLIFILLFILFLTSLSLSCGMQDFRYGMWDLSLWSMISLQLRHAGSFALQHVGP